MARIRFLSLQWMGLSVVVFSMLLAGCKHSPNTTTPMQALPYPVKIQYDWMMFEKDFPNTGHTHRLATCEEDFLVRVDGDFAAALKDAGVGHLEDGRIIGKSGNCECGLGFNCFEFMDERHPWGLTSRGTTRHLYTSVSASSLPLGTVLYIPALKGLNLPHTKQKHNGYVRVDSRNYFAHNQINLFVGTQKTAKKLSYLLKDGVKVEICEGPECRERILQF